MANLSPQHLAEWDQWLRWVDDELDYAYALFTAGDYNEGRVDSEGAALAERIQSVPAPIRASLIPIVMSRAVDMRFKREAFIRELREAMTEPVSADNGYVSIDRLNRIIERHEGE